MGERGHPVHTTQATLAIGEAGQRTGRSGERGLVATQQRIGVAEVLRALLTNVRDFAAVGVKYLRIAAVDGIGHIGGEQIDAEEAMRKVLAVALLYRAGDVDATLGVDGVVEVRVQRIADLLTVIGSDQRADLALAVAVHGRGLAGDLAILRAIDGEGLGAVETHRLLHGGLHAALRGVGNAFDHELTADRAVDRTSQVALRIGLQRIADGRGGRLSGQRIARHATRDLLAIGIPVDQQRSVGSESIVRSGHTDGDRMRLAVTEHAGKRGQVYAIRNKVERLHARRRLPQIRIDAVTIDRRIHRRYASR